MDIRSCFSSWQLVHCRDYFLPRSAIYSTVNLQARFRFHTVKESTVAAVKRSTLLDQDQMDHILKLYFETNLLYNQLIKT
jgi:hypothetical protein